MRIGVFGGSFDPIHRGHLLLAKCCADQAALDQVLLIPAAAQPLKPRGPVASAEDRLGMVQAAIASDTFADHRFAASTIELARPGPSYTVDTLSALAEQHPDDELFLLLGADSLADLPRWRDPGRICDLATPLVVARAGESPADFGVLAPVVETAQLEQIKRLQIRMPPTPISSTDIRRRIATGEPWQELVPTEVAAYIQQHALYGADGDAAPRHSDPQ